MNRLLKTLVVLISVVVLIGSCAKKEGSEGAKWTIGMSQCNLGEPWRVQMNADIKKAAEAHPELKVI